MTAGVLGSQLGVCVSTRLLNLCLLDVPAADPRPVEVGSRLRPSPSCRGGLLCLAGGRASSGAGPSPAPQDGRGTKALQLVGQTSFLTIWESLL